MFYKFDLILISIVIIIFCYINCILFFFLIDCFQNYLFPNLKHKTLKNIIYECGNLNVNFLLHKNTINFIFFCILFFINEYFLILLLLIFYYNIYLSIIILLIIIINISTHMYVFFKLNNQSMILIYFYISIFLYFLFINKNLLIEKLLLIELI